MNNTNQTTKSQPTLETKPIYFPLCRFGGRGTIADRIERYTNSHNAKSKDDLLFSRDLNHKFTDDEGDEHFMLDAAWRQAVLEYHRRHKIDPAWQRDSETYIQIDWTAYEKMAAAVTDARYQQVSRGNVFIAGGTGRTGKTVGTRWIVDIHTSDDIMPAWITAAEFAGFGAYSNQAVKMVETLRGVRRAYAKTYEKKFEEVYEGDWGELPYSVIDGICANKLSAKETFAFQSVIEACTDRGEYNLILTTPQSTAEAFFDQLAEGPNKIQIQNRLAERGMFIEFKPERVGRCPWIDDEYNLRPPYALPDMATYDFDQELDASQPLTNLPDGLCSFAVVKIEKKLKEVNNKGVSIGPRCFARVYLSVTHVNSGETDTLNYDLVLEPSHMLEFFTAIGQRKHGDTPTKFVPNWAKVVGSTGLLLTKHASVKFITEE